MKIINRTHWRTDHLRAIIARVIAEELTPEKRKRLTVEVTYIKRLRAYSSGCASIGGDHMTVRLSKHAEHLDKTDFAHTVAHECLHLRGKTHRRNAPPEKRFRHTPAYSRVGNWRELYAWAEQMPLEVKPKKARTATVDLQEQRHTKVLASIKRWSTKLKRAQTALKKLTAQRRYYERALATKRASKG